ncbi:MAG: hypothetical protein KAH84_03030 [Thiomargarita sp.]|nr:hypothetical protein [Thiomargarita sp.]
MINTIYLMLVVTVISGTAAFFQTQISSKVENANIQEHTWYLPPTPIAINFSKSYTQAAKLNLWKNKALDKQKKLEQSKVLRQKKLDKNKLAKQQNRENNNQYGENQDEKQIKIQLIGIVRKGVEKYVLLLENDKEINQYHEDSMLPNGSYIIDIYEDAIKIITDSTTDIMYLHPLE